MAPPRANEIARVASDFKMDLINIKMLPSLLICSFFSVEELEPIFT